MELTRLGNTGLKVSRLALGCMSYGDPNSPNAHRWALDDEAAQPYFQQALELGITFWDTANVYQDGTSEELVGRAIRLYSRREDIVLATKVFGRMHDGPGGQGLSRKAILEQVDASLARLGTDYIDLYQIHRFDPDTPGRGDDGGAARHRQGGQGPLHRRVVDVRLAVRQAPARRRPRRLDAVRVDAEPVQPAAPSRRARADGDVRGHGRRARAVLAAGQGPPGPAVGRAVAALRRRQGRAGLRLAAGPAGGRRGRRPSPRRAA